MNALTLSQTTRTMTSKEMADLTEKRHDSVKRTIDTLAEKGVISQPQIVDGEKAANGVVEKHYLVGKRDSYVIVAQLCPEFTARLVDRWQELEAQQSSPTIPQSLPEALRLAADLAEDNAKKSAALAIAAPKAVALDRIADADGAMNPTLAAKNLQVRPKDLFEYLREKLWIYRRPGGSGNVAYQDKIQSGLLTHKVTVVHREDGTEKVVEQVLVTPKGLARLSQALSLA